MRSRPRSKFEDENGVIGAEGWALMDSGETEYPEVEAWDKEYADECDRLSKLEAQRTGKRHWGRWYLTKYALVTPSIHPKNGKPEVYKCQPYDIGLDRLKHGRWLAHMAEKNWIGEQGMKDLERALTELGGGLEKSW